MTYKTAKTHVGHLVTVIVSTGRSGYAYRRRSLNGHLDAVRPTGGSVISRSNREYRFAYADVVEVICLTGGHDQ